MRSLVSEDDYCTGSQNVSHYQQQSYSGLHLPKRSYSTYLKEENYLDFIFIDGFLRTRTSWHTTVICSLLVFTRGSTIKIRLSRRCLCSWLSAKKHIRKSMLHRVSFSFYLVFPSHTILILLVMDRTSL